MCVCVCVCVCVNVRVRARVCVCDGGGEGSSFPYLFIGPPPAWFCGLGPGWVDEGGVVSFWFGGGGRGHPH